MFVNKLVKPRLLSVSHTRANQRKGSMKPLLNLDRSTFFRLYSMGSKIESTEMHSISNKLD